MSDGVEIDPEVQKIIARQAGAPIATPIEVRTAAEDELNPPDVEGKLDYRRGLKVLKDDEESRQRARDMQAKSRGKYREARALRSQEAKEEAANILATVGEAMETAKNQSLFTGPIDKTADHIVRMMANLILSGGPMFVPTTAKEASEMAKQWASIGASYRAAKVAAKVLETSSTESLTADVASKLAELKTRAEARVADPVKPGKTRQIIESGGNDDDDL